MNRSAVILVIVAGLAAGWWLPLGRPGHGPAQVPTVPASSDKEQGGRSVRTQELLKRLLDDGEWTSHMRKGAGSLSALLPLFRSGWSDTDVAQLVSMDPLAALDHFLSNPVAPRDLGAEVAAAWARKDPGQAIRHLWAKSSYRADDYLVEALKIGYASHPELVGEVIRSKPRRWQERYLETLFTSTCTVRKSGAPPEVKSDDPFADDGFWITRKFGGDLLDCLADDELREKARHWLEDKTPPVEPTKPEPESTPLDLTRYDPENWRQGDQFWKALHESPDETLDSIAREGCYLARQSAMSDLPVEFSLDPKSWPASLAKLEGWMNQLGVIPDYPPSKFGMGPFLRGPEVASWIDRQPLALRRAWAGTFVQTWVTTEPAAALDWARRLPEAAARDEAYHSGLIIWTHSDPPAASAAVEALPPGELRESAISNAAAAWATIDRTGAAVWLETLPASPGKARALERIKR